MILPMARRMLAWLLVTPLAAAGVLAAHAAAYAVTGHILGEEHGYLEHAPQVAGLLASLALLGLALQERSLRPSSAWWVAPIAPLGFTCQEHLERLAHTGELPWLLTTPTFLVGLALHAAIEPGEDHVDRRAGRYRLREQRRELDSPPQARSDRLGQPRLADRPRLEERQAVSGALHRRLELDRRARAKLVEGQRERLLDRPAQLEPPRRGVDERDVVVDQEVVESDRRDRPAESLERQCVVARRKT